MHKEKNHRLINLTLKISLTVFIILISISVYLFENKKTSQENHAYEIGRDHLILTSKFINIWVKEQLNTAKLISKDPRVIAAAKNPKDAETVKEAHKFLQEIQNTYPYYNSIPVGVFIDENFEISVNGSKKLIKNGTFITDGRNGELIGKGGLEYNYIRNIFNGKDHSISDVYHSIWSGVPILVMNTALKDNDKAFGFAGVAPDMDFFRKSFIDHVKSGQSGYLFIFDERKMLIAHPDKSIILNDSKDFKKQAASVIDNIFSGNKFFQSEYNGIDKYYVVDLISIDNHTWYMCFTQNKDEVLKPAYTLLKISILGSLILSLLTSFCIYITGEKHRERTEKKMLEDMNLKLEGKVRERTKLLQKKAVTDSLTGLFNHGQSLKYLREYIKNPSIKNITIIMADLDNFKKINDSYGHPMGDKVLTQFSKLIKSSIRSLDIPGRYGGEEFIIILPNTKLEVGIEVAERIRVQLSQYRFKGLKENVTSSFGISQWKGESAHLMIKKTDALLYLAKASGKNCLKSNLDS